MKSCAFAVLLLATALPVWAEDAATNRLTVLQRLEPACLQATRAARERFAKEREPVPQNGVYEDVRAVLNVRDVGGDEPYSRRRIFKAANSAGVRVVVLGGVFPYGDEASRGEQDGVFFFTSPTVYSRERIERGSVIGTEDKPAKGSELSFPISQYRDSDVSKPRNIGLEIPCHGMSIEDGDTLRRYFASENATNKPPGWTRFTALHKDKAYSVAKHIAWTQFTALRKEFPFECLNAGNQYPVRSLAEWDRELEVRHFTGIARGDVIYKPQYLYDYNAEDAELLLANASTHLLLREVTEVEVRAAVREGRAYIAHDWLCDPTSFTFVAVNNLGTFHMGESAPFGVLSGTTHLMAQAPLPAKFRLIHHGQVVSEQRTKRFEFAAKEPGAYRLEVWLDVAGEERPWIYSNPVYLETSAPVGVRIPPLFTPPGVEVKPNIAYVEAASPDPKQRLDVFRPRDRTNAPVFVFLHGGAWRFGDRNQYGAFGNHFAREGIVTVVPSYRLAPQHPYPAQIEDAAAAFAWTVKNIAEFGGDPRRIYVGGHSAGGHLSAVLALDARHLLRHGLTSQAIHGVLALSGVYDMTTHDTQASVFGRDPAFRRDASPLFHVGKAAPPFLVTYCQWDYYSLPLQAKQLDAALRQAGQASELIYTPGENHIMEAFAFLEKGNATAQAILKFLR